MADWSLLPEELLRLILGKLSSPLDNSRFSAVCKLWYSIYKDKTFVWLASIVDYRVNHTLSFFSLTDREVYHIKLPELENKIIWGASHGLLVTVDRDCRVCLLDPFSRTQIQLPQNLLFDCYSCKVFMSYDPRTNPNGCIIMAYAGHSLTYCRLGDDKWTSFPKMDEAPINLAFCKGRFYAQTDNHLFICHIDHEPHFTTLTAKNPETHFLVDLAGDLLAVTCFIQCERRDEIEDDADVVLGDEHESHEDVDDEIEDGLKGFGKYPFHFYEDAFVGSKKYDGITCDFSVFKLDAKGTSWTEINDIGDKALLLDCENSVALPASPFPGWAGNAIYYSDKYWQRDDRLFKEVGIFHFKDRRIHSQYVYLLDAYYDDNDYDYYDYLDRLHKPHDFRYNAQPSPIWLVQGSLQCPRS